MYNEKEDRFRPLSELNLLDNFLFHAMLMQEDVGEEFCKILLRTILGKEIRKVRITPQKDIPSVDTKLHGIRMDAYIEDISGSDAVDADIIPDIYDLEPNKAYEKDTLPKRMRYYHGVIDAQILSAGKKYDKLPKVIIIFILPYDPFGKNRMMYTFRNGCVEDATVEYDDGAVNMVLYTRGTAENPSKELRDMLHYMEKTTAENVTNEDIHVVHSLVDRVKSRGEVNLSYMKSWEWDEYNKELGRTEGIELGRTEGLKEGIRALLVACRNLQVSKEDALTQLMQTMDLEEAEARAYLEQYYVL